MGVHVFRDSLSSSAAVGDLGGGGQGGSFWELAHEALEVGGVGGGQGLGAGGSDGLRAAVVDIGGGVQPDSGVPVIFVVPGEEALAERSCVLD